LQGNFASCDRFDPRRSGIFSDERLQCRRFQCWRGRDAAAPAVLQSAPRSVKPLQEQDDASAIDTLPPREFEILRMLFDGRSADKIAAAFNLSPKTVSNYHHAIKSKLSVSSDVELVLDDDDIRSA
jgi:DNA-binding NarL/FixJ family response regulator